MADLRRTIEALHDEWSKYGAPLAYDAPSRPVEALHTLRIQIQTLEPALDNPEEILRVAQAFDSVSFEFFIASYVFAQSGGESLGRHLIALANRLPGPLTDRYQAWLNLEYLLFIAAGRHGPAAHVTLREGPLFDAYRRLADEWAPDLSFPPGHRPHRRFLLLTRIWKDPRHYAPARDTLHFARGLRARGAEVALMDCNLLWRSMPFPAWPPSAFAPDVPSGWSRIDDVTGPFSLFRRDGPALADGGLHDAVAEWQPDAVIAFGDGNLWTDALARSFPTYCIHYTADTPISSRSVVMLHHHLKPHRDHHRTLPYQPSFTPSAPSVQPRPRPDVLGDDGPAIAIIGHRLHAEVDTAFLDALATVAKQVPAAKFIFIGGFLGFERVLAHPGLRFQAIHIGVVDDLAGWLAHIDLVLNPPRLGGGTSAAIALQLDVPVFSLNWGDSAIVVGANLCVATLPELAQRAVSALTDPEQYQAEQTYARQRKSSLDHRDANLDTIYGDLERETRGTHGDDSDP